jgi:hypothetical protein
MAHPDGSIISLQCGRNAVGWRSNVERQPAVLSTLKPRAQPWLLKREAALVQGQLSERRAIMLLQENRLRISFYHQRGGIADPQKRLPVEGYNVVASRKALHEVWKDRFVPCVASIFVKFPEIQGAGNENLIVMPCYNHWLLEDLTEYLIHLGLRMTSEEKFSDFAIVHGTHGLPMQCTWLQYRREGSSATVEFRSADSLLNIDGADCGYDSDGWIRSRGHGFVISRDEDYDVWLDFITGETVVTLHTQRVAATPIGGGNRQLAGDSIITQ